MSWVDKAHKKNQTHKLVEQAMKDPRYVAEQKKYLDDATLKAFDSFLLISVDFLYRHHNYKKNGILNYIDFVVEQMHYIESDEEYFRLLNSELEKETGVNILNNLVRVKKQQFSGGEKIVKTSTVICGSTAYRKHKIMVQAGEYLLAWWYRGI